MRMESTAFQFQYSAEPDSIPDFQSACKPSSQDPFEALVEQFYEPLYKFAFSLTRNQPDASDLAQHTFYVWATKGFQLRDRSKVKTWLFTTLHRAFLGNHQKHNRVTHYTFEEASIEDLPAPCPDIANALDSRQVLSALARVDAVYQAAVSLFYVEDCSYQEIANILEIPVGTVKSRIARGIAQLRLFLGVSTPKPKPLLPRDGISHRVQICILSDPIPKA